MKKKAIESIPYLGLKKVSRKKDVKYIGVTTVKIIGHEKHLFLEVYRNKKESEETPLVRIVLTKKDFGNYFPEKEKWTRQQVDGGDVYYGGELIWSDRQDHSVSWMELQNRNILQDAADQDRIKKFCNAPYHYNEKKWWGYIAAHEQDIVSTARRKTEQRKYEKRKKALEDRIAHTGPLPEKEVLDMADSLCFQNEHYLYYKKHGGRAKVACSKCGGVADARWKAGVSYESQFQRRIEEPREGHYGTCSLCGTLGIYKCQGKVKSSNRKKMHLFLGQKYKEKGMVFRYLEVSKEWQLGLIEGKHGPEMYNSCEMLQGVEVARAYFEPDKSIQIDYHKRDWNGDEYWDDCNLYGNANITIRDGMIMPETYEQMKGTMFQYSALQEYTDSIRTMNPINYLECYIRIPQLEMLVKMGLTETARALVEGGRYRCNEIIADTSAKRPDTFLGIRKEKVKQLIRYEGDTDLLRAMKMEKRSGQTWTEEQIVNLVETELESEQVELATEYMTLQKLLNRIKKYAGCEYWTNCSSSTARIQHVATTYIDYLSMRIALGYDLSNAVYQQPRDLDAAHAKMVEETNKEKADKRIEEVQERFKNIQKNYKKLRKRYFYEDSQYLIRPARSAEEIVMEGRLLHHCVGGDNYLRKHNEGKTYILMLRFKTDPNTPYITVEIDANRPGIIQWYGAHDRKPDAINIQQWLDDYLAKLKNGSLTKIITPAIAS